MFQYVTLTTRCQIKNKLSHNNYLQNEPRFVNLNKLHSNWQEFCLDICCIMPENPTQWQHLTVAFSLSCQLWQQLCTVHLSSHTTPVSCHHRQRHYYHTWSQSSPSRSTKTRISSGTAIDGWVSFNCIATYNDTHTKTISWHISSDWVIKFSGNHTHYNAPIVYSNPQSLAKILLSFTAIRGPQSLEISPLRNTV